MAKTANTKMNLFIHPPPPKESWPEGAQYFIDPGFYKISKGRTWFWGIDDWVRSTKSVEEVIFEGGEQNHPRARAYKSPMLGK